MSRPAHALFLNSYQRNAVASFDTIDEHLHAHHGSITFFDGGRFKKRKCCSELEKPLKPVLIPVAGLNPHKEPFAQRGTNKCRKEKL